MWTLTRRLGGATLAAVSVLGLAAPQAEAQVVRPNSQSIVNPYFRVAPGLPLNQAAFNTAVAGQALQNVPPWVFGYNPYPPPIVNPYPYPYPLYGVYGGSPGVTATLATTPAAFGGGSGAVGTLYSSPAGYYSGGYGYGGYGGCYGGGFYGFYGGCTDPYAGYLSGASQVIQAQAQFLTSQAQADLLKEQRRQMQLDTHRKVLEEWVYERNLLANLPDPRDVERKFLTHRALNNPPLTEILTGDSLNYVLANVRKLQEKGATGPDIRLDEELLKDINVTNGERGNIGLLRKGGRLTWPLPLQGAAFEDERKRLDLHAQTAYERLDRGGEVGPGMLQTMRKDAAALHAKLNDSIRDLTPSQYVDAKRYLNQLDDALTALGEPNVRNHITGKFAARGKTVEELVRNMAGLTFNAATQGDEQAYRMLLERLTAYNAALEQAVAQR